MKNKKSVIAIATAGALLLGGSAFNAASASSESKNVVVVAPENYEAAMAQYLIDAAAYEVAEAAYEVQKDALENAAAAEIAILKSDYANAIVGLTLDEILVLKAELKVAVDAIKAQLRVDELALGAEPVKPAKPILATDLPVKKDKKKKGKR